MTAGLGSSLLSTITASCSSREVGLLSPTSTPTCSPRPRASECCYNIIINIKPTAPKQPKFIPKTQISGASKRRTSFLFNPNPSRVLLVTRAEAAEETMATHKPGIKVINNPPESKLNDLGVRSWPKWGCHPSKFPWTYSSKETCYLLKGKVKVYPDGSDEAVEIGAGDLVEFPKGMSCTWDVSDAVDKHYNFE